MKKLVLEVELDGVEDEHERGEVILGVEGALAGESIHPSTGAPIVVESATVIEYDGTPVP